MAREKISTGGATGTIEDSEVGEQEEMFPDIDPKGNNLHKRLLAAAKDFKKKDLAHKEAKDTLKEERDAAEQKFLGLMHEANIEKFRHKGIIGKVNEKKETASVKIEDDAEDGDE